MFSPDGRWIAYTSNEGGQNDVYVQPFPANGNRQQVSKEGGTHPVWRADGKELFFLRTSDGMLMSVPIPATTQWDQGTTKALFISGATRSIPSQQYAATRDGSRFLVSSRPRELTVEPLTVVVNWLAAVQK